MEIIIVPDQTKTEALRMGPEILKWLMDHQVSPTLIDNEKIRPPREPELAIILGGDGFLMRKAQELPGLLLLGINLGTRGFLAVAERNNWPKVLKTVIEGDYFVDKKLVLAVWLSGGRHFEAIADVYLRHPSKMIRLKVSIDGQVIYRNLFGDGIVVSAPLGSTAYNLSAGGPIAESGIILTPICPHAVNTRSLVLKENREIEIEYLGVKSAGREQAQALLVIDGREQQIIPGDKVLIKKSQRETSFVIPKGFSFFRASQKKLGLSS
jgi:NAD+ kinase